MWQRIPVAYQNGEIIGYEIRYNKSQFGEESNLTNPLSNATSYVLDGLEEFVEYVIQIRAYTKVGLSDFSLPTRKRTLAGKPTGFFILR